MAYSSHRLQPHVVTERPLRGRHQGRYGIRPVLTVEVSPLPYRDRMRTASSLWREVYLWIK